MTKAEIKQAALTLPPEDQLDLAQEIWDRLAPRVDLRLTPELQGELESRLAEAEASPSAGVPVEEAHRRIRDQLAGRRRA